MSGHGNGEAFSLNPNAKEWHPSVECKEESQSLGGKLNPNACEWHPWVESTVESRCLYFTFSNGFPLTREQIYHYFTWKYGPCVEFVDIHEPRDYGFPLFGKIIFNFSTIPVLILKGKEKMQFCIDGRPICCKKFKPKDRGA